MNDITAGVIVWMLTSALSGMVGWTASKARHDRTHGKALEKGMRVLLRARLEAIYTECEGGGKPLSIEKKHDADEAYAAYDALDGNGWGSEMHDAIMRAPIREGRTGR